MAGKFSFINKILKRTRIKAGYLCWILIVVVFGYTDIQAQTSWDKYSDNPVLPHGPSEAWDEHEVIYGWVMLDNETYKIWYTGSNGSTQAIGYATSFDGITWMKHSGNPVLSPIETWEGTHISIPTVMKDGGTYKMWYTSSQGWEIGYATSTDGVNWTKYSGNPVLTGTAGQWDAAGVRVGTVMLDTGTFKMWYSAPGGAGIGYSTSMDGITWTKYSANPVLSGNNQDAPLVLKVGSDFHMWHHLPGTAPGTWIGYSSSTDGIQWTEWSENPVLTEGPSGAWDAIEVQRPSVILDGNTFKMWFSGLDKHGGIGAGAKTQIGYATSQISPGSEKWHIQFTGNNISVHGSPAIGSNGMIYIGAANGLYAYNPDGTQKWYQPIGQVNSAPTIETDGTIYVGEGDHTTGHLYAFYPDGTQKWQFDTPSGAVRSSPAIGSDGTIYIGSHDNYVYALDPDGTQKWRFQTGGIVTYAPAVGADGTIYIGSSHPDYNLYAINSNGSEKWRFDAANIGGTSPVIAPDGTIYYGTGVHFSNIGHFYAIYGSSGGLAESPWPMFQRNVRHTGAADPEPPAPDLQIAGTIAFGLFRNGNNEIYTMNTDGTGQTNLTNNGADDLHPSWSPEGSKIAFTRLQGGDFQVYGMDANGSNQVNLTQGVGGIKGSVPGWSPDGSKIAFRSFLNGQEDVYVMNSDGSDQTNLTNRTAEDGVPEWSPDGSQIVFESLRDGNFEIYVMNPDGTGQTRLTDNPAQDGEPDWSPDGTKIVFFSFRDGNQEIYTMNADGTDQTNLSNNSSNDSSGDWASFRHIGSANIGAPAPRTMTIENKGNGDLSVTNITSSDGQFTISPTSFSVAAGGSQNVIVTFTPTSAGTKYSTLTIRSNDPDDDPINLIVNGTGNNRPPIAVCKDVILDLDASGKAELDPSDVDDGSSDPDGDPITLSLDKTSFTCGELGPQTVTLTVTDDKEASSDCSATVTVRDVTDPVPDAATLPAVTGECSATISSSPTATDNCSGAITGTTTDALTRSTQGTSVVTWTFDDGNGNTSTQTQNIVVKDVTDPVPDVATLPAVTGECSATISSSPTATDNCSGTITGTTSDHLARTTQGTSIVTWTFDDGNGNTSTQTQNIVVKDVTDPVPDAASLAPATGECSATISSSPTATDNCSGTITGTTADALTRTTQGTSIVTWTFDDGNGNISTHTQNVVVKDVTDPVPDVTTLLDATGECSASIVGPPTATDNCAGTIIGTTSDQLAYSTQGTFTVTWTFDDGNGNNSTQTQNIIVDDVTGPVPDLPSLPDATGQCSATISTPPTATDNCSGASTGTTTDPLTRTTQGTSIVTWTFDEGNGNTSSQTQNIVVEDTTPPVITDITLDQNVLWPPNHKYRTITVSVTAIDNCDPAVTITGTVSSDEPDEDKTGDGNTTGDIKVTSGEVVFLSSNEDPEVAFKAGDQLELRCERKGDGDGRVYTITVTATDASGKSSSETAEVTVPHDQGKGKGKKLAKVSGVGDGDGLGDGLNPLSGSPAVRFALDSGESPVFQAGPEPSQSFQP